MQPTGYLALAKILILLSCFLIVYQHVLSSYGRHAEGRGTHSAPDLRQSNDPYWSPCDYTTDADPNGCL